MNAHTREMKEDEEEKFEIETRDHESTHRLSNFSTTITAAAVAAFA